MKRTQTSVTLGDDIYRIRVRLETDECEYGTPEYRYHQFDILRQLADTPDLSNCGLSPFQKLTVYFMGNRWIAEAEAEVTQPGTSNGKQSNTTQGATGL